MVEKYKPSEQNEKQSWKWFKKSTKLTLAALAAVVLAQQPVKANPLEKALKYKIVKVYKFWKDGKGWELIVEEPVTDNYPSNLKIYGVWQQIEDKSYNGVWVKVHTDNFEWVVEWSSNYKKVGWVAKINLPKQTCAKLGLSYLKLKDYLNSGTTVKQTAYGVALWKKIENFYVEFGRINYHLNKNLWDAYKNYIELVKRIKTNAGQFDIIANGVNAKYDDVTKNYAKWTVQYYPTENTQIWVTYSSQPEYSEHDYKVEAWVEYKFWSNDISPYFKGTYNPAGEHTQIWATYEENIANKDLSWKDEFEQYTLNTNKPVAEEISPEKFKEKLLQKEVNKLPEITISASKTSIILGESITLTAKASDPDGSISQVVWYDANWNKIWTGTSITIKPNTTWTFTYYATAIDNKWAIKKSNPITIEVKEQAPVLSDIQIEKWAYVDHIEKVSENEYKVYVNSTTHQWVVTITFNWNKWTETKTVSWYWDDPATTVTSDKYPQAKVTIDWEPWF